MYLVEPSGPAWDESVCRAHVQVCAKLLQLRPALYDSVDCSLPSSSAHGILQARILEWIAMPFPSPGDLPDPGVEPTSLMSPALAGRFFGLP